VFLFDEPLSSLDAQLRIQMRTQLKDLHRELRTTVVYVTHDQEEAMTLGDRMAILREGVVQQCGTPLEVYNRPANRFVAGFVGTPLMNFFDGRLECNGVDVCLVGRIGRVALPRSMSMSLRLHGGQTVSMGIRPQHVWIQSSASKEVGRPGIEHLGDGVVRHIETLGDRINVHVHTVGGESLVAHVPPTTSVLPGDSVSFGLDLAYAHVFSVPDGRRLHE
jgi:multiple sugar transport system ATP-binding protein